MSRIIDISQTLQPGITVWPGDTEFRTFWVMCQAAGAACNVGSITMSLHTGTHADAPFHVQPDGLSMENLDLTPFIGTALVVDATDSHPISAGHIRTLPDGVAERVLFRTKAMTPGEITSPAGHFLPEAARGLVAHGVRLVGIDTPSVDPADSDSLEAHHIFAAAGVVLLENLRLDNVPPGRYELIALPLKLAGMDASPVRAILRTID